jgi:hypothetical protein
MIIEIFTIMILSSFILIGLGYYIDVDILKILGFFFIFVIGITLINDDGIQYQTGETITTDGTTSTVIKNYADFDDWRFNVFLSIVGAMGMTMVFIQRKAGSVKYD